MYLLIRAFKANTVPKNILLFCHFCWCSLQWNYNCWNQQKFWKSFCLSQPSTFGNRQINLVKIYITNSRENAILILFFLIIFFPLSLSSYKFPSPPYPLNCTFSVFIKKNHMHPKQTTRKTKQNEVCFVLAAALESGWYTWCYSIWDNWFSFSQHLSITNRSLAVAGTLCPLLFFILGFCLARTCAGLVCAVTFSMCSCVQAPCCFWKMLGFWSHSPPLLT